MDKHLLTLSVRNFLTGQRGMDLVGIYPASALAEEPEGYRPTDILYSCKASSSSDGGC